MWTMKGQSGIQKSFMKLKKSADERSEKCVEMI